MYYSNGNYFLPRVDEFDKPVLRTQAEYPYSYDGFILHRLGKNEEANATIYTDRLSSWGYEKKQTLSKKHFNDTGDDWSNRKPSAIQDFLREYTGDGELKLIFVMQYCHLSSGYPLWRLDYKTSN